MLFHAVNAFNMQVNGSFFVITNSHRMQYDQDARCLRSHLNTLNIQVFQVVSGDSFKIFLVRLLLFSCTFPAYAIRIYVSVLARADRFVPAYLPFFLWRNRVDEMHDPFREINWVVHHFGTISVRFCRRVYRRCSTSADNKASIF